MTKPTKETERTLNHADGNKIRHIRELLKLSQTDFAETLDISQAALSYLEKGETTMSFPVFKNLVQVHNVNAHYFLSEGSAEPVFMAARKQARQEQELKNKLSTISKSVGRIQAEVEKMGQLL